MNNAVCNSVSYTTTQRGTYGTTQRITSIVPNPNPNPVVTYVPTRRAFYRWLMAIITKSKIVSYPTRELATLGLGFAGVTR